MYLVYRCRLLLSSHKLKKVSLSKPRRACAASSLLRCPCIAATATHEPHKQPAGARPRHTGTARINEQVGAPLPLRHRCNTARWSQPVPATATTMTAATATTAAPAPTRKSTTGSSRRAAAKCLPAQPLARPRTSPSPAPAAVPARFRLLQSGRAVTRIPSSAQRCHTQARPPRSPPAQPGNGVRAPPPAGSPVSPPHCHRSAYAPSATLRKHCRNSPASHAAPLLLLRCIAASPLCPPARTAPLLLCCRESPRLPLSTSWAARPGWWRHPCSPPQAPMSRRSEVGGAGPVRRRRC